MTGILGESGVGKSTFINIINGLIRPDNGTITVDKVDINSGNNIFMWQKNISYVPQKIYLMDDSIKNNIVKFFRTSRYLILFNIKYLR